jgi:hypothetical protein
MMDREQLDGMDVMDVVGRREGHFLKDSSTLAARGIACIETLYLVQN